MPHILKAEPHGMASIFVMHQPSCGSDSVCGLWGDWSTGRVSLRTGNLHLTVACCFSIFLQYVLYVSLFCSRLADTSFCRYDEANWACVPIRQSPSNREVVQSAPGRAACSVLGHDLCAKAVNLCVFSGGVCSAADSSEVSGYETERARVRGGRCFGGSYTEWLCFAMGNTVSCAQNAASPSVTLIIGEVSPWGSHRHKREGRNTVDGVGSDPTIQAYQ